MRHKIGEHGVGGRNESLYYAEYEPETGKAFWVREWDNVDYKLNHSAGEDRVLLEDASRNHLYEKAVEVIQQNHPEWQPTKG
ncbi:hypothetical protein NF673_09945 [Pseudomonas moraviensis]|uniref:hypothetical protein n=1 Tax=Pseudomonas moraviensis TaxID=321662 RepID=UPI0020937226|nr:hypothetical protein [Pseudomonas moraviensis]UST66808.1 hypothetical protein NF673_09945 [Pseudomonas moraviensis]